MGHLEMKREGRKNCNIIHHVMITRNQAPGERSKNHCFVYLLACLLVGSVASTVGGFIHWLWLVDESVGMYLCILTVEIHN